MPSDHGSDVRYPTKEIKYGRFERVLHVPKNTMVNPILPVHPVQIQTCFSLDEYHIGIYE